MAIPPDSRPGKPEHPSTYFVQDRSNEEELIRLDRQDRTMTEHMGGVMAEQKDPASFERVLDVGCGPGWWLIETARTYPSISTLVGVDISEHIVSYARAQAAQVSDRVQFQVGDALRMLEFPTGYFDLVNQRFGLGYLRQWDWPKLLKEYQRVCKPEGIIRITELGVLPETNSPALRRLIELFIEALYQAGHLFTLESEGLTRHLPDLMRQHGIQQVQTTTTKTGSLTPEMWQELGDDARRTFRTIVPFLRKWIKLPSDYQDIYRQLVYETQQLDYEATPMLTTVWGTVG